MLHQRQQTLHTFCRERFLCPQQRVRDHWELSQIDVMGRTYSTYLLLLRSYIILQSARARQPGILNEYAVYEEICKTTCDMHLYATWESSSFEALQDLHEGTIMSLDSLII